MMIWTTRELLVGWSITLSTAPAALYLVVQLHMDCASASHAITFIFIRRSIVGTMSREKYGVVNHHHPMMRPVDNVRCLLVNSRIAPTLEMNHPLSCNFSGQSSKLKDGLFLLIDFCYKI